MTNITLYDATINKKYTIENVLLEDILLRRLEALGINEGTLIEVITKKSHGAMVVKVRGTRLALGKHITQNIEIREEVVHND